MNHFVILLKSNGRPTEIRILNAPANITAAEISPYQFPTADAANAYARQLEAHNGIIRPLQSLPQPKRKSVKNVSTGQVFPSAAAAAASVGVSGSFMSRALKAGAGNTNVKGYVFMYQPA